MGGKSRVVAAAVFCVKHQGHIQYFCLKLRISAVLAKKAQDIFCRGKLRLGIADNQALVQVVMAVGVITVDAEQGELGNQP